MENYSIDEILSAVDEIQGRKKDNKKKEAIASFFLLIFLFY